MSVQQFCLRWNNHQPNFISVCSSLLHNGTLVDVTLAAEGRQLQAHKIVLSACSSYFQALFTTNPCQHPIVILKDVQYDDLKTMVDFMYYGEVNVSQEQLPHILKTAEMLKIKGLAEMPTDPANLTKSDSKSSSDGTELVGGGSGVGAGPGTSAGSLGAASGSSVGESLWSSSEAQQFQQQQQQQQQAQQQQQQQHHHHQQQQQLQQQQQQQAQQQQQQQHHHHHQQQAQTAQAHHHQMRRTPSPLSAGTSPATRRKRLRKSSNNGSGERNNVAEEHNSSLEAGPGNTGLSLAQMSQMSFGAGGGLAGHSLHAAKLLKESAAAELEQQPQDSDLDDGHGHIHMQIKPEVDIGGVNQAMPLDISGATTPSEHDAPNSQSSHSEPSPAHAPPPAHPPLGATSSSSGGSGSFERSFSIGGIGGDVDPDGPPSSPVVMGTKRNRVLTRQPRVKRDSDSISSTNQISPDTAATTLDFDPFNAAGATTVTARDYSTTGSHHLHHPPHQGHHHHHQHLLTVPPRIERHASEPAPSLGSSSSSPSTPHLLSVPSSTPYLIKQHSDPLLPRQSALQSVGSTSGLTGSNPFAPLHRQYSHPLSGSSASYVPPTPLHHPHHISLPESIYASGSPPPAGSSQYLVPTRVVAVSSETAVTPTIASSGSSAPVSVVTSPTAGLQNSGSRPSFSPTYAGGSEVSIERRSPHSPTITRTQIIERGVKSQVITEAANGGSRLRTSKSASGSVIGSSSHLHPGQATMSSSFEHLPTLRVKNEELQRSVSSPQTQREIITLENPRSSHCPVIRPGPALGCNFCWNTIDGHGRILRRKTKYHCPECQTNLCIVPCFQEYHERLNNEAAAATSGAAAGSGENQLSSSTGSGSGSSSGKASPYVSTGSRHYTKTESI
ncbi:hypothetical protein KR067_010223 [Drosophila pandora]|nr:hypothetical protein KR067_010223 [Drosophila pandora]